MEYLIGTGGWNYFNIPGETSLKAYSKIFDYVEVNYTFYQYPNTSMVKQWRASVSDDFLFSVRCHQDLTHKIGLKPVHKAYEVIEKMLIYCDTLQAPFLVLETPASYDLSSKKLEYARDFFASLNLQKIRLVWEIRSRLTENAVKLMKDLNIIHCVDLSWQEPSYASDITYSRLFGKGRHNLYQFTDDELTDVNENAQQIGSKVVVLTYHGARMYGDAARFKQYQLTGKFVPTTSFVGIESAKSVLSEDAVFPASKDDLIRTQGWKVIDLSPKQRVHLSDILTKIPQKIYYEINDVLATLEAYI